MVQQLLDEDDSCQLDFCLVTRLNEFQWSFPGKGAVQWRSDIPRQRCSKSSQCQNMGILKPTCLCGASTRLS
jgi:hypothetical protein